MKKKRISCEYMRELARIDIEEWKKDKKISQRHRRPIWKPYNRTSDKKEK